MRHHNHLDQNGDLRDIFAAVAMHALMNQDAATSALMDQDAATSAWVATQAYVYADAMLDQRDAVSHTKEIK